MIKKLNFKNKSNYQKWLGYGHASGEFTKVKGDTDIYIDGKKHKVNHLKRKDLKYIV